MEGPAWQVVVALVVLVVLVVVVALAMLVLAIGVDVGVGTHNIHTYRTPYGAKGAQRGGHAHSAGESEVFEELSRGGWRHRRRALVDDRDGEVAIRRRVR